MLGVLLGMVAVVLIPALLLDSRGVTSRVAALVLPRLSAALGREVTLREADLASGVGPRRASLGGAGAQPPRRRA